LLASAAQNFHDWGEIWSDLNPSDKVNATFTLSSIISDLELHGFWVFGLRTEEEYPAGAGDDKWPIANVRVLRKDSPEIVKVDLAEMS